ncbi:S-layer homology domain-containing protein [Cohnella endophytica]|nr:S-layer homology domain-containing protein [Cohnella endophytica]
MTFASPASSSNDKDFLSFSVEGNLGIIDKDNHTISVVVPFRSAVTNMLEIFTVSDGATVQNHTSYATRTNYSGPVHLTVIAEDGSAQVYTVTVTIGPSNIKSIRTFNLSSPASTGFIDDEAFAIFLTVPQGTDVTALQPTFTTDDGGAQVLVNGVVQTSGGSPQNFTHPLTYTVKALDGSTRNYTVTVTIQRVLSTAKEFTSFGLASLSSVGIIDESNYTIALTVPFGTNRAALVPSFVSTGTRVLLNGAQQVSGEGVVNFTSPVNYVVYDEAGGIQIYTVTVTVAAAGASATKEMLTFSIAGVEGIVDETAHTVVVTLPNGTSRTHLKATFTTSGASVRIGSSVQTSGSTSNDFTSTQTYTVFAENGLMQNYAVTVVLDNQLKSYNLISPIEATGVIDPVHHTISFDIPYGTDLSITMAEFETTGDRLVINGDIQESGVTENDLRLAPIIYTVDSDNSGIPYTLILNRGLNPAKELTSFSFANPQTIGAVDQSHHTVAITVPFGTDLTQLTPSFTSTGKEVRVGVQEQASGVTTQDFTNPVTYSVYAEDGLSQDYVVTVAVAGRPSSGDDHPSPTPTTPTEPETSSPATVYSPAIDQTKLEAYLKSKVEQAPASPVSGAFSDINQHWSKSNIDLFVTLGFITGYQDGTFRPNAPITRAEFAALIARIFPIETSSSSRSFKDVKEEYWASQAIRTLASNAILSGYADGSFRPNQAISRAEIIAIISRLVDFNAVEKHEPASFNDVAGTWNADVIRAAAAAGIVEGRAAGTFAPNESSTRAEALSILLRVLNLSPEIKTLLDQLKA